jgi:hypothetical protein
MTEANVKNSFLPGKQDEDTTKQRVFKFLDGLKLANLSDIFSPVGEKNLANKFRLSIEEFKEIIEEHRQKGGAHNC